MTLLEAISARHSVRKYLDKEIPADIIAALQDKIAECNKVGNLSIQLVQNETKAFNHGVQQDWQSKHSAGTERDESIHGNAVVWFVQRSKELSCDGWQEVQRPR